MHVKNKALALVSLIILCLSGFFLILLQHRVGFEDVLYLGLEFDGGELQQANGLLQLGGHGQLLTDAELECLLHILFRQSRACTLRPL